MSTMITIRSYLHNRFFFLIVFSIIWCTPEYAQSTKNATAVTKRNNNIQTDLEEGVDKFKQLIKEGAEGNEATWEMNIRSYYNTGSKLLQDSIRSYLLNNLSAQLRNEYKKEAIEMIDIYSMICERKDSYLGNLIYTKGKIYAENENVVALKSTIAELEYLAEETGDNYSEEISALQLILNQIQNPYSDFVGLWIADCPFSNKKDFPDYLMRIELGEDNEPVMITYVMNVLSAQKVFHTNVLTTEDPTMEGFYEGLLSKKCYLFDKKRLYSLWHSKNIKISDAEFATAMRSIVRNAQASVVGNYARTNEYSFGERFSANIAAELTASLLNGVFDRIFISSESAYILEQNITLLNLNKMHVNLKVQRLKSTSANPNDIKRYNSEQSITFYRLEPSMEIYFLADMGRVYSPTKQAFLSRKERKKLYLGNPQLKMQGKEHWIYNRHQMDKIRQNAEDIE